VDRTLSGHALAVATRIAAPHLRTALTATEIVETGLGRGSLRRGSRGVEKMGFSALATSYLGGYYHLKLETRQRAAAARHHGEKRKLGQLMRQGCCPTCRLAQGTINAYND
jgi:hypothetical protein